MAPRATLQKAPRVALLLLLLAASSAAASSAAATVTCPAAPAATSCYTGFTATVLPSAGGACTCSCGGSALAADYEYVSATSYSTRVMQAAVASAAACTADFCSATWPHDCGEVAYQTGQYTSFLAIAAEATPTARSMGTSPAVCYSWTSACAPAGSACPAGFTEGSVTQYSAFGGPSALAECTTAAASYNLNSGGGTVMLCNTDACNAPP
jgi:hypothetical protein